MATKLFALRRLTAFSRALLWAITLFSGCLGLQAQSSYPLIAMTNEWRYNQAGINLGVPWRGTNYVDTAWPIGRGAFGHDTNFASLLSSQISTQLSLSNASNVRITTYYFRTHFILTNNPFELTITITNLVDDGAVFFINSNEIARVNMPAAPATIAYLTPASSSVDATYKTFDVPPSALIRGDNTLAVEVHNANTSSLDIGFGLAATVNFPQPIPIVITNQPASQATLEDRPITFSVGASGLPREYQWFKDGLPLPNAQGPSLTLTNVLLSDGGQYWVTISNAVSFVESFHAALLVIADTNGPTLLSAERTNGNQIRVTFSDPVAPGTATNLGNYAVTNLAGRLVPLYGVTLLDSTNILLTSEYLSLGSNYVLIVNNVQDQSRYTNSILPNSAIPITCVVALMDEYSFWYFYNPYVQQIPPGPGDDNPDLGTSWRQPDYLVNQATNDFWGDNAFAPGAFWIGNQFLPADRGVELSASACPTTYFRANLNPGFSPLGASFELRHLVQDGAVFYVNGSEAYRYNMPAGPIAWTSAASAAAPAEWKTALFPVGALLSSGESVIAAELHASHSPPSPLAFALRLSARVTSVASGPVMITSQPQSQTVIEGQPVSFSFMAAGAGSFQWFENGVSITGATNPVLAITNAAYALNDTRYSVVAFNASYSAISSNATLTVLADTNPPALLGAYVVSSNQIIVKFSKPVTPGSATALGNYAITNNNAPNLSISSAVVTNGTNVILTVGAAAPGGYVLVVNHVRDTSTLGNVIPRNSSATVGIDILIPFNAVWKYNNLGQDLGTAWRTAGYSDNTWSNGMGMIYNEGAPLPGPKNTLLPLTSPSGAYVVTFYFREHLGLAVVPTNTIVSISHIIDDAAVFYANNIEFSRFNFSSGLTVNYNTSSDVSVADGVLFGPINYNMNSVRLVPGDNIIAAEVHQFGTASSDFCFGAEITIKGLSVVTVPPPVLPTSMTLTKLGVGARINWTNTAFRLEKTIALEGANTFWQAIPGATSPYIITNTTGNAFYRLSN